MTTEPNLPNLGRLVQTGTWAAGELARLDTRIALGLNDIKTTLEEVVRLIPDLLAEEAAEARETERLEVHNLLWEQQDIINEHADGFLQEGVVTTVQAIASRIAEERDAGALTPEDLLTNVLALCTAVENAARDQGKKPSEVLEYETGAFFATAHASEWALEDGSFAIGTLIERVLP